MIFEEPLEEARERIILGEDWVVVLPSESLVEVLQARFPVDVYHGELEGKPVLLCFVRKANADQEDLGTFLVEAGQTSTLEDFELPDVLVVYEDDPNEAAELLKAFAAEFG